ncbi:hypothetical protein [Sphingobium sp. Ndbn-10]|uniref:DUF6894 family protein n=1 Tax=Sphingobium sp. Ndbn-10 TaxID=1667223 RepID=UPI000B270670|nr:hypothetical protein [Sphingobium sp. Ndbn-10]
MPIFHIHLFNDDNVIDEAGQQFADVAEARAEAIRSGREIIAEHVIHGRPVNLDHHLVCRTIRAASWKRSIFAMS